MFVKWEKFKPLVSYCVFSQNNWADYWKNIHEPTPASYLRLPFWIQDFCSVFCKELRQFHGSLILNWLLSLKNIKVNDWLDIRILNIMDQTEAMKTLVKTLDFSCNPSDHGFYQSPHAPRMHRNSVNFPKPKNLVTTVHDLWLKCCSLSQREVMVFQ